jgi:IPTL-CTERM motif
MLNKLMHWNTIKSLFNTWRCNMAVIKHIYKAAAMAALALAQTVATAQVVYGPVSVASVPTLSEWGMIIMAVVLAGAAVFAMRKGAGSKAVMSLALAALGMAGVSQGHKIMDDAFAVIEIEIQMTNPAGGVTGPLPQNVGDIPVRNTTPVPLQIISVTPLSAQNSEVAPCRPGVIVPPNAVCYVSTDTPT